MIFTKEQNTIHIITHIVKIMMSFIVTNVHLLLSQRCCYFTSPETPQMSYEQNTLADECEWFPKLQCTSVGTGYIPE